MRRSICYCEPKTALAGQIGDWSFVYTTTQKLVKGARLKFDLNSSGRDIDWELPSVSQRAKDNVLYLELPNGKVVFPKEIVDEERYAPDYEFTLSTEVPAGETVTIYLGSPPKTKKRDGAKGNQAQVVAQRRRPFFLYVDAKGKGKYEDPEVFALDVRGNQLANIRILTPSFVARNRRFDVTVRFEDEYGNLTAKADEGTMVELTHEHSREHLNWQLFVPETGFITLPNLYFNELGIYTITLRNTQTDEEFQSAPIRCTDDPDLHLFWGRLHGESERYDSTKNIESCLRYLRDEQALHFTATSPFDTEEETPPEVWKRITHYTAEFNEEDRFVTFLGFQWVGADKKEGIRHIIYAKDNRSILRQAEAKSNTLRHMYEHLSPKEAISIPSFTMGKGTSFDFANFDPEREPVVEIYNAWGCSEDLPSAGNPAPIKIANKKTVSMAAEGAIQTALQKNNRFGFVAGGLDDRGVYADFYDSDQEQYAPGLTAIMSKGQSRADLFEALRHRRCYATTGERMIISYDIAGIQMGQETSTQAKPGLDVNRHIQGVVAGTADLDCVEIIRNGEVIHTIKPEGYHCSFAYDDLVDLSRIALDGGKGKELFVYYYVRASQVDGHAMWGSPIWVDLSAK